MTLAIRGMEWWKVRAGRLEGSDWWWQVGPIAIDRWGEYLEVMVLNSRPWRLRLWRR